MWTQMGLPSNDPGLLEPPGERCHRRNDLTAERTRKDAATNAASPAPAMCGRPLHKACSCCRPAGHLGPCNCAYPGGSPATSLVFDSALSARQPMTAPSRASDGRVEKIALSVDAECRHDETIVVMDYSSTETRQAALSKTPELASNPDGPQDELASDQFVAGAMARRCGEVAALHLEIRRWQEAIGQNQFADICDSQPDLSDALGYYVTPGGNFWLATTSTGELARFRGVEEHRGRDRLGEASRRCPSISGPRRWIPINGGADGLGAAGGVPRAALGDGCR